MIGHFLYCGISTDSKRVWGAFSWIDSNWKTDGTYLVWGSKTNPMIKKFSFMRKSKKQRLGYRVEQKRFSWSGYRELGNTVDVNKALPDLESQIGMWMLARKLRA